MDLINVHICYWCFVVVSLPLWTESVFVVMYPSEGFNEYTDIFFTGTVVILQCTVDGVDFDNTNTTIYVNNKLILASEEQSKTINGIFVWRSSNDSIVRLQMNLTLQHCGKYTCRVESDEGVQEDSFILNVVSHSPQCIIKRDKKEHTRYQHICYSQTLQNGEYFTWEKANQNVSYTKLVDFTAMNIATKSVSTLNNMTINTTTPEIYKCSVWISITNSVSLVERFCIFNLSHSSDSNNAELQGTCEGNTSNMNSKQPGSYSLQPTPSLSSTLLKTPTHTFDGIHSNLPVIFYIGIPCMIFSIIVVLLVVCFVIKRNSQKHSDDSLATTAETEAHQAGNGPSTSFVNVAALDNRERQDKQSKPLTEGYTSKYKQNERNSQLHIYNEIEEDKTLDNPVGDYQEPINIRTGSYEITDLCSEEKETYEPYLRPTSTPTSNGENVNIAHEANNLNQTSGEIGNIAYEPHDGFKAPENTIYAVLDSEGKDDTDEESNYNFGQILRDV